jgi:hypothetical protein
MSRLTLDPAEVEKLTRLEGDLLASWRATLTHHTASPQAVAWSIEDAVRAYPGLGLRFEPCDGPGCGQYVHGADPASRLVLCDACEVTARDLSEALITEVWAVKR